MVEFIRHFFTTMGVATSHPRAFFVVFLYGIAWHHFSPESFDWHAAATMAVWLMTLLIQRASHRDTQAIHAKLDELLRADSEARTELAALDDEEPEVIERERALRRDKSRRSE